eukprot:5422896-Prymnesium_polylepis.1
MFRHFIIGHSASVVASPAAVSLSATACHVTQLAAGSSERGTHSLISDAQILSSGSAAAPPLQDLNFDLSNCERLYNGHRVGRSAVCT